MAEISFKDIISSYEPAIWAGAITFLVILIIEVILCSKGHFTSSTEKKLQRLKNMAMSSKRKE